MNKVILIPIYKNSLSAYEEISLKRCFDVLSNHRIVFVCSKSLDISAYSNLLNRQLEIEYFDNNYFEGIKGYNKLMLSLEFYQRFDQYSYILIYQLDCYIFKDDLNYWANQGYDYIGAPWLFEEYFGFPLIKKGIIYLNNLYNIYLNHRCLTRNNLYLRVGNGGLSLRKVDAFITYLAKNKISEKFYSSDSSSVYNEDVYWSLIAKDIKKPTYKVAVGFSLDPGARRGFIINNNKLPFGCHAWDRNLEFWKQYITLR